MKPYVGRNLSDEHVTVGSLEVLGGITGPGITSIKKNIDSIQRQSQAFNTKVEDYWSKLSDDGLITPNEKEQIKREWQNIRQSYSALYTQAVMQGLQQMAYFSEDYKKAYDSLDEYLNVTLRLFDDMQATKQIEDRDVFNTYFSDYYYAEKFVQIALSAGIVGKLGFRVLESLSDEGTEGEVGLYRGQLYQYVDGNWEAVGLEGYLGTLTELPAGSQNQYFMAESNFEAILPLYTNDSQLLVNNLPLYVTQLFIKGMIYVFTNDQWVSIPDTTDYRYVVALIDYINVTGELPGAFQAAIDEVADRVDEIPVYRGKSAEDIINPKKGDFYCYAGTLTAARRPGYLYLYEADGWNELNPNDSKNGAYYMQALQDILSVKDAYTGNFATLFASSFFAAEGTINKLGTMQLTLKENGIIQSENTNGFKLKSNGDIDTNGNTHIGGTLIVDGEASFGSKSVFAGRMEGATGSFSNGCIFPASDFVSGDSVLWSFDLVYEISRTVVNMSHERPRLIFKVLFPGNFKLSISNLKTSASAVDTAVYIIERDCRTTDILTENLNDYPSKMLKTFTSEGQLIVNLQPDKTYDIFIKHTSYGISNCTVTLSTNLNTDSFQAALTRGVFEACSIATRILPS